jgi:hypothetical protein
MLGPLIAVGVGIAASLATGGSLERLGGVKFRYLPLFWLSLVVSLVTGFGPDGIGHYGPALVVLSNVLLIVFAVTNRGVPGLVLVAVGVFLNALVITLNGAMPVSTDAARQVASTQTVASVKHEALSNETVFPLLADRIPMGPTQQVWSVGDFLMVAGFFVMGFGMPRRRGPAPVAPRRRSPGKATA